MKKLYTTKTRTSTHEVYETEPEVLRRRKRAKRPLATFDVETLNHLAVVDDLLRQVLVRYQVRVGGAACR